MNLHILKGRAGMVLLVSVLAMGLLPILFGGVAPAIVLVLGVVGSLALLVLLLAIVADATVQTLKKEK